MRILQACESLAAGDAVANDVVAIDALLKKLGMCGGVYVTNDNNINKKYLHTIAEPITTFPDVNVDDILLFHHAISNDFCYKIPELKCKKVLVYHNITPPSYFLGVHEGFYNATKKGLEQVKQLNSTFDCCIVYSEFSKSDLLKMGYTCPIYVCPILIPLEDYAQEPNRELIEKYSDGCKNIIFVGRISPNKKQEDILHMFALYKRYYDSTARLFLVGSDGVEDYGKSIREYVKALGVSDVIITGSVPFKDILAYYSVADAFVCMSEHEGFCVPLVEAMYFNIPIFAYESSAIPYTLRGCGVTFKEKDYAFIAGMINRVLTDSELRKQIVVKQREVLSYYSYENVSEWTQRIINSIISEFVTPIGADKIQEMIGKSETEESFTLILPIKAGDWKYAKYCIPLIKKNIRPRKIIIFSSSKLKREMKNEKNVLFIDENRLIDGMTLSSVRNLIIRAGGDPSDAGWFLKQLINIGYSKVCPDKYYLVWDADTLPLNPISFFDESTGKPLFNLKREYVPAYFETMQNLLGLPKCRPESFITEHMLFDKDLCNQMILDIESNESIEGKSFWEKCISASVFKKTKRSFAEYETYGTYAMIKSPETYLTRKLKTFRCGAEFLGEMPSEEILSWVAKEFDTVSLEHWGIPVDFSLRLVNSKEVREKNTFGDIVRFIVKKIELQSCIGSDEDREYWRFFKKKMEFDWFFGDKTVYEEMNK